MPLKKYRSVEEIPKPTALPRLDPDNLRLAFSWMRLANRLDRRGPREPGVRRFLSAEERP